MWSPTHVQVTVCRARGLLSKGKNGTNDCFVTISLGKEKFQTSVKLKSPSNLEWQEECELPIPTQGNTAEIVLTALHQNFIGVDEFLGMVTLPLSQFDVYERPRTRWYPLNSKPGQEGKNKNRGEIEVKVGFTVKSGSMLDLSKKEKHKGSLGHLTQAAHNIGGSLMNLGGKDKKGGIKKLASSVGSKLRLNKKGGDDKDERLSRHSSGRFSGKYSSGDPDPGVISEDDDEFRFDELSHKSSGSSLNLAGSSQASGQGSLENLGGGELLRHNSMKRSGSSVTSLSNRAVASASSSSNLAALAAANSAASKSPGGGFFGKQGKGEPVKKVAEEASTPAASSFSSLPSSSSGAIVAGGVPSIIIQDSFVVEEPSLLPPVIPSSSSTAPVPKPRQEQPPSTEAVAEPPPPTKPRRWAEADSAPGEDDDASWPRMLEKSVPPSFPVAPTYEDDDDCYNYSDSKSRDSTASHPSTVGAPPVPKPRRSPLLSHEPPQPPIVLPRRTLPEAEVNKAPSPVVLLNPFDDESDDDRDKKQDPLNPFADESDVKDESADPLNPFNGDSVREDEHADPLNPFESESVREVEQPDAKVNATCDAIKTQREVREEQDDREPLSEDSVCQMLEQVIEEHQPNQPLDEGASDEDGLQDGWKKNQIVKTPTDVIELYNDEAVNEDKTVDFYSDQTLDLFNNRNGEEISPVEKAASTAGRLNESTPPVQEDRNVRRDRLGFFSTPRYTPETPLDQNVSVVRLDWMEASGEEDESQGFGGSEHSASGQSATTSAVSEAVSQAAAKTLDSAVPEEDEDESGEHPADLEGAKNRRLSYFLPRHEDVFTPPLASVPELADTPVVQSTETPITQPLTAGSAANSVKGDLSWDNYDLNPIPTPKAPPGPRRSMVPPDPVPVSSPFGEEEKSRRKRVSLAPCLKTLTFGTPGSDLTADSPVTEQWEEEEEGALAGVNNSNETQRMKMAASFHQRVVVGEDKPVNNMTPRDFHAPRDSPSTEDRQRLYQGKSREGLISLLEERDNEISDLKDYIDCLLLRVIDTCPTVLQTPIKSKNSARK